MRRYIVLLLITGTVWAQTGLDKLVLKDGTEYFGKYLKVQRGMVYFNQLKSKNERLAHTISLQDVHKIQLIDGKIVDIKLYKEPYSKGYKNSKLIILSCALPVIIGVIMLNSMESAGPPKSQGGCPLPPCY